MAGGETLQPAASEARRAELRDSVQRDIADGLRRLYPVLDEWPRSMESLKRARRACIVPLQFDGVSTDDFTVFAPFVAVVRSDDGSNPTSVSVEPDPTGSCQYRLRIPSDLGEDNLTSTPFNLSSGGEYLYIAQGAFGFWTERKIPLADQGGYSKSERLLLCAQDPDNPELISIEQVLTTKDWRSVFEAGAEKTEATRVDGDDVVVPEAESRSIRDQVLERIREALSRSGISYSNLESPEDLIKHVYAPRVLNAGDEQLGFSGIVVVRPKKYSDERPDQITVSIWGEQPILYIQSDSDEFRHIGEGITTHFGKKRFEQFGEEEGVLLVMQREGWYEEYATEAIGLSRRWREAFKEDGRMVGSGEDQDRLESVEVPASPYRETVVGDGSTGDSRTGTISSLRPSGDVFSGSRHSSEDHALGRHDSPPRPCSYEDPERVRRERDRERDIEEEQRKYIGATPVVSEEDSPYAPVKYVRDKGGKWVPEDPENRRRGERQSRRGRSNPLGGMTVATPQTFTRIAEQPRRESASVPAEETSGAKTGEQKRPEGRFKRKANEKAKEAARKRRKAK